jgi:hypothetical protein
MIWAGSSGALNNGLASDHDPASIANNRNDTTQQRRADHGRASNDSMSETYRRENEALLLVPWVLN